MPVDVSLATAQSHLRLTALDRPLDRAAFEAAPQSNSTAREIELQPARVIDQPLAELTIAQDDAWRVEQRDLRADDVVGERAGTEQDLRHRAAPASAQSRDFDRGGTRP